MAVRREHGSRAQRPWSVYRASTFELSNEMISLALAGEKTLNCQAAKTEKCPNSYNSACVFQEIVRIRMSLCWSSVWVRSTLPLDESAEASGLMFYLQQSCWYLFSSLRRPDDPCFGSKAQQLRRSELHHTAAGLLDQARPDRGHRGQISHAGDTL